MYVTSFLCEKPSLKEQQQHEEKISYRLVWCSSHRLGRNGALRSQRNILKAIHLDWGSHFGKANFWRFCEPH